MDMIGRIFVLPRESAVEGSLVGDARILAAGSLLEAVADVGTIFPDVGLAGVELVAAFWVASPFSSPPPVHALSPKTKLAARPTTMA